MRAKRGGGCAPRSGVRTLASVEKDAGVLRVQHVHLVHAEHSVCIGVRHDQPCSVSCPRPRHCMGWVCLEKVKCPLRKRGSSWEALELSVGAGSHSLITRAGRSLPGCKRARQSTFGALGRAFLHHTCSLGGCGELAATPKQH